jgi:hypothetical protein
MKIIITEKQLEKIKSDNSFEIFATKRLSGAEKISNNAKEKGGPAMLTYHHFVVKLPYYKKASKGNFNLESTKTELSDLLAELSNLNYDVDMGQTYFQRLVGKIEVLGELIIKHNEENQINKK